MAYEAPYKGGVNVAVGDVNGDGLNDIVVSPSTGKSIIRAYLNQSATNPGRAVRYDASQSVLGLLTKVYRRGDGRGRRRGRRRQGGDYRWRWRGHARYGRDFQRNDECVNYDRHARRYNRSRPFDNRQRGGVSVAVANVDADAKLEIVVGSGVGGGSQMAVYDTSNLAAPVSTFLGLYSGSGSNAPIRVRRPT